MLNSCHSCLLFFRRLLPTLCVAALLCQPGKSAATIPQLIREALARHPAVVAQAGLRTAAQAAVETAHWQYWPTPSIGLERASTSDPAYAGDRTVATLRLQQPLWTGGRLDANLSKAKAQAEAAEAEAQITRQQLALRVLQAWSEAVAAQAKVSAYEQSRDVHARLLELVERRTREGVSAQADIDLARSRLDGTEADLATAMAQRQTAQDKLRLLVGRSVDTLSLTRSADEPRHLSSSTLDAWLATAREHSPQLAKAHAQASVAQADIALAKAALSPEVYLRAERQYGSSSVAGQAPQNRFFVGVSSAFGAGLSSLSFLDDALARHRAAIADIDTQQLALEEQVLNDATLARTASARLSRLERARQSAADVSASWERQFLAGRKQWQDLMNAEREQTQNDVQLADALATQVLTGWRLTVLTQGLDAVLAKNP